MLLRVILLIIALHTPILAPAIGILSGFAFAGLGSAVIDARGDEAWGLAILGLYTGYCVGTAGGINVIAEGGNKDLEIR